MRNLSEQKFGEMIYAFSAGCLDKDELRDFLEYLNSGRRIPDNQLGELQNVVALMPAMLELESPSVQVKDKVAKRLYRMREELKAKKRQGSKDFTKEDVQPLNENVFAEKVYEHPEEKKNVPPLKSTGRMTVERPAAEEELSREKNRELRNSTIVEAPYKDAAPPPPVFEPAPDTYITMDAIVAEPPKEEPVRMEPVRPDLQAQEPSGKRWVRTEEEEEKPDNSFRNLVILTTILVFVLITGGIIYFAMNREIHQGKDEVASLSGQVNALNNEILRLDRNQKVLAVLSAKDLKTINLDGADGNSGGFGKLSLLANGNEGVIQFYNMPALQQNQVYQLWLKSKDKYYSLGIFRTKRDIEYFPFSTPEISQNDVNSYMVTLEDSEGNTSPSKKVYLMTTLNGR